MEKIALRGAKITDDLDAEGFPEAEQIMMLGASLAWVMTNLPAEERRQHFFATVTTLGEALGITVIPMTEAHRG